MRDDISHYLTEHNITFTLHQHAPTVTVQDASDNLPFPVERFLKTIVFRIKEGDWVLAAVRGRDRVDYRKLAVALGVNRRAVIHPSADEIEAALGFQIGGITPIPLRDGVRVIFDTQTQNDGVSYCGAGRNDQTLELHAPDLARATHSIIADIITVPSA